MVRITGVEPAPSCPDQHLKLARLPIPPYPHKFYPTSIIISHYLEFVKSFLKNFFHKKRDRILYLSRIMYLHFFVCVTVLIVTERVTTTVPAFIIVVSIFIRFLNIINEIFVYFFKFVFVVDRCKDFFAVFFHDF